MVLAAGGARVSTTYVVGKEDAELLAAATDGEPLNILAYDVRASAEEQLASLDWDINHAYYFASPAIFRPRTNQFDVARFQEFCEYYVDGFARLCAALRARSDRDVKLFYPSTTAIEERPAYMTEYVMAKAAGEILCADIGQYDRRTTVLVRRLPRVSTDQTTTIVRVAAENAIDLVLPFVRAMHADGSGEKRGGR